MADSGNVTQFTTVDAQADPRYLITFLDAGSTVEGIQRVKRESLTQLDLQTGHRVLDVGCGTGEDVRNLAHVVGSQGCAIGVDVSGVMIAEAANRHGDCGLPVAFGVSDAQYLAFADATFDRCRTDRALMHLKHPEQGLAEMVRVVRPGGKVVVFDFDWGTTFVDHPDESTTRKVIRAFSDGVQHGWIGRRLPRLCQEAGLVEITCVPHVVYIPYAIARHLLEGALATAQATGAVSAEERTRWWRYLEQAEAAGQCCIGQVGFMVQGTKS
ncbi:MAG: methyltransferase domain-containing protein [Candidatus Tectomicrobia bacterium]|nr:methyltransferase domain-containing protein [Candidatus Tectomicrobia bacterium]